MSSGGTATAIDEAGHPGHRPSPTSPGSPRCSTTAWSRCTRRCTAASSPTAASESHLADLERARHRAVRPRRLEPLPVPRVARHRDHRHRRPGDDARRGEEPRVGRDRHEPRSVRRRARRAPRPTARSSDDTRRALALEAFARTAAYDAAIVRGSRATRSCPQHLVLALDRTDEHAALRREPAPARRALPHRTAPRAGGTASPSTAASRSRYLNSTTPTPRGSSCTTSATGPTCAIIKHANPCGVAVADDLATAYQRALECDERSAFGGIVALNRPIDAATVERMVAGPQADVVIAPGYDDGTIEALRKKRKNTRLLEAPAPGARRRSTSARSPAASSCRRRTTSPPAATTGASSPRRAPTDRAVARRSSSRGASCGHVKSNAIVLVKDGQAVGIGAGQQNRVESGEIAAKKAAGRAAGGARASDAFYPFPDGIEAAAAAGVAVVIQPGGSMRRREGHRDRPTSSGSRWCSPANGTSCIERARSMTAKMMPGAPVADAVFADLEPRDREARRARHHARARHDPRRRRRRERAATSA